MKKRKKINAGELDINFFNAVSYELAGEIGVIDNEDVLRNKRPTAEEAVEKKKDKK